MSAKSIRLPRKQAGAPKPSRAARRLRLPAREDLARSLPVSLFRASHPKQAGLTALFVAVAAGLDGRPFMQVLLVFATVLTGQVILGWHNDLVDVQRDRRHQFPGKPLGRGVVDAGSVWFALAIAVLLVVPLSVANGVVAAACHLFILGIALVANSGVLRRTRFSALLWMASFALWPAFLSYGGVQGTEGGNPPGILVTVLAALLGLGVHVLTSLPGLVTDNADGVRHFPLVLALRTGAPRLLIIAAVWTGLVGVGILITVATLGAAQ
jgi:4-hydroxybenzoate polyprenyltransferase